MMKNSVPKLLLISALICALSTPVYAADSRDAAIDAQVFAPAQDASSGDGKAMVYALEGKAVLTSKGSPVERNLKVGDQIQAGDAVYTEKGTTLSISFDNKRNNAVRIPAESRAIFTSIEPTDIKLENGSIFSVVDGLAKGSTWKITTPSAVAAVRGTVFVVRYESASGQMYAATVNVPDDGKTSAIEITALTGDTNAEVGEGKEIVLKEGQSPSEDMVKDLSPEAIAEIQNFFQEVSAEREESSEEKSNGSGGNGPGGGSDSGPGDTGKSPDAPDPFNEPGVGPGKDFDPPEPFKPDPIIDTKTDNFSNDEDGGKGCDTSDPNCGGKRYGTYNN